MEYMIRGERPFEEIESLTVAALQQRGLVVHQTFSLKSIAMPADGAIQASPGYSVLMLYCAGAELSPMGFVTLFQRAGRTVVQPVLIAPTREDAAAEFVEALVLSNLDFCVSRGEGSACIDLGCEGEPDSWREDGTQLQV